MGSEIGYSMTEPHEPFSTEEFQRYVVECGRMASLARRAGLSNAPSTKVAMRQRPTIHLGKMWMRYLSPVMRFHGLATSAAHR